MGGLTKQQKWILVLTAGLLLLGAMAKVWRQANPSSTTASVPTIK